MASLLAAALASRPLLELASAKQARYVGDFIAKAPWGVALVISGAGLGPDTAEKAGVC